MNINDVYSILGWPVFITSLSFILSFLICVVTGLFFDGYPARKASYIDPIDALRYE